VLSGQVLEIELPADADRPVQSPNPIHSIGAAGVLVEGVAGVLEAGAPGVLEAGVLEAGVLEAGVLVEGVAGVLEAGAPGVRGGAARISFGCVAKYIAIAPPIIIRIITITKMIVLDDPLALTLTLESVG
jgi:hypothetical protein